MCTVFTPLISYSMLCRISNFDFLQHYTFLYYGYALFYVLSRILMLLLVEMQYHYLKIALLYGE